MDSHPLGHCSEGLDRDPQEGALLASDQRLCVRQVSTKIVLALVKEDFFVEGVASAHLEPEGLPVESHLAAAVQQYVDGFLHALPVAVQRLVLDQEVDPAVLDQVLAGGLLQAEQDRVISLDLTDA